MTVLSPYLGFRDNAREALDFYHSVFGGEIIRSTFGEMHASDDPSEADKIMHSQLTTPNGLTLMASDTPNSMDYAPLTAVSISLSGGPDDEAELTAYWQRLSGEGSTVTAPLMKAPWGDLFGMCTDRFGVNWLVNVAAAPAPAV